MKKSKKIKKNSTIGILNNISSSGTLLTGTASSGYYQFPASTATASNFSISNASGISIVTSGLAYTYPTWDNISEVGNFCELVLAALGYDITFEDFKNMSTKERGQIIRDIKLKTIL